MVRVKHNVTLLAVLIFFTIVIVVGLGRFFLYFIFTNIFLFYSILLGAGLFLVAHVSSHVLSKLAAKRRLSVRLVSWTLLAPLCFSLTLFTLVYVFGPIEQRAVFQQTLWSLTVPKDVFWTWFGIFPLNVMMFAIWFGGLLAGIVQEEPSILGYTIDRAKRKRILTLYVKSMQRSEEIVSSGRESAISGTLGPHYFRGTPMGDGDAVSIEESFFPKTQGQIIEMIKKRASEHGFAVRTVDLAREAAHHRVTVIPTLISDSGKRLEGKILEEQLELFLASV